MAQLASPTRACRMFRVVDFPSEDGPDQQEGHFVPGFPGQTVAEELLEFVDHVLPLDGFEQEIQPAGGFGGGSIALR